MLDFPFCIYCAGLLRVRCELLARDKNLGPQGSRTEKTRLTPMDQPAPHTTL